MTTTKETSGTRDRSVMFNRSMYGAFVLLSIYFFIRGDVASAMSNLGIALIFDPFDQKIKWNDRPHYQRIWLFVHVGLVFALLAYLLLAGLNIL